MITGHTLETVQVQRVTGLGTADPTSNETLETIHYTYQPLISYWDSGVNFCLFRQKRGKYFLGLGMK